MAVFAAGGTARTMDFEEGDVGYVPISNPHYVENIGDSDLVFWRSSTVLIMRKYHWARGWLTRRICWSINT